MESLKENKKLYIDKETLSILSSIKHGVFSPVDKLMNKEEMEEVDRTGTYKGSTLPISIILNPAGKRNQEVLSNVKMGEELDFYVDSDIVGTIVVDEVFKVNKKDRMKKIMGGNISSPDAISIYQTIGELGVSGEYKIKDVETNKDLLAQKIKKNKPKKISAVVLTANPIHAVHEQILRDALEHTDMLVIFIYKQKQESNSMLPYSLRLECINYIVDNFLVKDKVIILPLEYTYLFAGQNKILLNALVAGNYGCTEYITSFGNTDLSTYYVGNKTYTILDSIKGINIKTRVISEHAYCDICNTIVNSQLCPHGKHHHITYDSKNMFELLKLGIMPPEIFIRREISAMILSYMFPSRFRNLDKLYYEILSQGGLLEAQENNEEKFYKNLFKLYHVK